MGCGYLLSILFCLPKCLFSDIYHLMSLKSAFKKDYFNWRIIIIWYFWWFCAIYQHESAIGVHVSRPSWTPLPPPFPLYPSGLSQSTGFGCPASWMDLALVICFTYGKVHISMLFSQNIPPLTSPIKKIKQNLPLLTKWVRCSKLHTWKILDEDLKLFISESNRIIFLLPRERPAASRTCRTLSEIQSLWYLESDLLNHNLHVNYSPWYFLSIVNLGKC